MANGVAVAAREDGVRAARLWLAARLVALGATVVVIVGLFATPDLTLKVLWKLLIPLVPASLLVSPMLWRNVCPLATLNLPPAPIQGRRAVGLRALTRLSVLGMVLLAVLVTARHVLFNGFNPTDGTTLGVVVVAVALAALVLGLLFESKSGFCNSFCPVLPVERLYGQSPLLRVGNPRCSPCTACTKVGCIDLGPDRSISQVLGKAPVTRPWFLSSYGVFAAAFPGFVLGYFLAEDGPLSSAGGVFLRVGLFTAASYVVVATLASLTRAPARLFMPALGAAAVGIYYWFAAPILSRTLGLDGATAAGTVSVAALAIRAAAFALVGWWLIAAYLRPAPAPGANGAACEAPEARV